VEVDKHKEFWVCRRCGANLAEKLLFQEIYCPYCGGVYPVDGDLKTQELRVKVKRVEYEYTYAERYSSGAEILNSYPMLGLIAVLALLAKTLLHGDSLVENICQYALCFYLVYLLGSALLWTAVKTNPSQAKTLYLRFLNNQKRRKIELLNRKIEGMDATHYRFRG